MSETQKLTPAFSMPGRDLLRPKTYAGLTDKTTGGIEHFDSVCITAEGKELYHKRPISKARQSRVDRRKTLFMLLLLFAIPANDCSAQTPPPPVDEHAFEGVSPTVMKRLATGFSLGPFAGCFEKTTLGDVREAVGVGKVQHQGDAGSSIYWLCYTRARHRLWVISSGEIGGPDHLVTEIFEQLTEKSTETPTDCATTPNKFMPVVIDDKLRLGMSRLDIVAVLGPPSKSEAARMVYSHHGKPEAGFEETAWLNLRFRKDKLVSMRGAKTTTD